jgi:solute carrier family 30 (zinc transporter), member 2
VKGDEVVLQYDDVSDNMS